MASAYVKKIGNASVIEIDGKLFTGGAMTVCNHRDGVIKTDGEYYKRLAESGIKLFFVMCDLDFCGKDGYKNFCEEMQIITSVAPDCYVIPRIALHPSAEWVEKHPDAVMKFSDGKSHPAVIRQESGNIPCCDGYSLYSKDWKEEAGEALMEFIEKSAKEPFAKHIIGYFLGAGSCSEWHAVSRMVLTPEEPYYDTGEDFRAEFQAYLDEKYGKDEKKAEIPDNNKRYYIFNVDENVALRSKDPSTFALDLPALPNNEYSVGSFADVEKIQDVVDFYMALGRATANSLVYFAGLIKEKYPDKLTGAFFGYTNGVHQTMNLTGLQRVLTSGVVDFCAAPGCYENRASGGNEPVRSVRDTYPLHKMTFFAEDDTRTHLECFAGRSGYGVYTEQDSVEILKRNFAKNLCGGNYSWWYDQQLGGGRYKNTAILNLFKKQSEIAEQAGVKRFERQSEIAFVFDIESAVACSNYTSHQSISVLKNYALGRMGASYDEYLLEDLENENTPDYKLYIFATVCDLDEKKRAIIKKKLQKNHAVALWLYGAGFINPEGTEKLSVENMNSLTGFEVKIWGDTVYDGAFRACGNHEIAQGLQKGFTYGVYDEPMFSNQWGKNTSFWKPYLCPMFTAEDGEAIGKFCEGQGVAAAIKEYDGFTSVFCGVKYLQYDFLSSVAKYAGVHIYTAQGDVLYASKHYFSIHAKTGGEKRIALPKRGDAYELYEDKYYGKGVESLTFEMEQGQTKTFLFK